MEYLGFSLGVVGVLVASVQGVLIRWINPRLGARRSVFTGLSFYALGLLLFAFAQEGWMMYVILVPYCLGGISGPALQSIMSGQVNDTEQGELQGGLTSLLSLTAIVGPPVMTNIFSYHTQPQTPVYFPGAPFLVGALLPAISIFLARRALHRSSI